MLYEVITDFVEKNIDKNYVELKSTRFKTVFANDILKDARNTWVHNFSKNNYKPVITSYSIHYTKLYEFDDGRRNDSYNKTRTK